MAGKKRWFALAALSVWLGCEGSEEAPPPAAPPANVAVGPMHRLNRAEYRNTIRDLLGSKLDPAANFPADDVSFGFDNIAAVLSLSPTQFELYEQAATDLAAEALAIPVEATTQLFEAESLTGPVGTSTGSGWNLWSNGEIAALVELSGDGDYELRARVWGQQAGPDPAQAALTVDGVTVATFDVVGDENAPELIEVTTAIDGGNHQIGVAFLNDYYEPPADRNLIVDWIEVEGPLGVVGVNPIREEIVFCDPADAPCRRDILEAFGEKAWRRPLAPEELDRLEGLMEVALEEGDTADAALELGLRGILLAPHFLFRPELDDDPTSETPHWLGDYELASRISYFLWSSMPDDELRAAAAAGLQDEAVLRAQVDRMLADPKAGALVENFAGQWLLLRALASHAPDYETFPEFDEVLRESMRQEMELYFGEFLAGRAPLDQILASDFTFLNDRLAEHYGLPAPGTTELEQVSLESDERFGLLTMGSLLTVTSYPNRTSPVKRGVWILEQLLCDGPPPPPPGVEGLIPEEEPTGSLRERLEAHRADPQCASCHMIMDPLGFGLEHYDGVGAWRDEDVGGFAIDATGEYFDQGSFDGAREMAALIQADPRFTECLLEKLFVYALGRGVETPDYEHLAAIAESVAASGYQMPELIKLLVTSPPFRMRRGTKEAAP